MFGWKKFAVHGYTEDIIMNMFLAAQINKHLLSRWSQKNCSLFFELYRSVGSKNWACWYHIWILYLSNKQKNFIETEQVKEELYGRIPPRRRTECTEKKIESCFSMPKFEKKIIIFTVHKMEAAFRERNYNKIIKP